MEVRRVNIWLDGGKLSYYIKDGKGNMVLNVGGKVWCCWYHRWIQV
ncbi:hypothetical protein [Candidatus Hodgkinia cicadicola]